MLHLRRLEQSFVCTADSFTSFRSQLKTCVSKTFVAGLLSAPSIPLPGLSLVKFVPYLLTYFFGLIWNTECVCLSVPVMAVVWWVQSHKDKHILNITDFMFLLPVLEYHNQTWTWRDLALAIKNDCKSVLIAQVTSTLHRRPSSFWPIETSIPVTSSFATEDTEKSWNRTHHKNPKTWAM